MKSLLKAIRYLFSGFWHGLSIFRVVVGNLLFLALIVFLLLIFLHDDDVDLPDQAALVLSLRGDIVEQKSETVLSNRLFGEAAREETLLRVC